MMTFHIRRPLVAVSLIACLAATPLFADSLWSGEGSLFRLETKGAARTLRVERPSQQARTLGLQAGAVVFQGKRNGASYSGTFFDCAADGIRVDGRVVDEVTVVFDAPQGGQCGGLLASGLALRYAESASANALVGSDSAENSAAQAADEPAPAQAAKAQPAAAAPAATAPAAAPAAAARSAPASASASAARAVAPLTGGTLWQAKGFVLRLLASGTGRQLSVARSAQDSGIENGTVLFEGRRVGQTYEGRLFDPLSGCAAESEIFARAAITGETRILLSAVDLPACASGLFREPLDLTLIGKDGAARVAADVAEQAPDPDLDVIEGRAAVADGQSGDTDGLAAPEATPDASFAGLAAIPARADIPAKACLPKLAAEKINLAVCRGLFAGWRIAEGASPEREADRQSRLALASGATDLYRAVDAACYADADRATYETGLDLARTRHAYADALRPLCIDALAKSAEVPAADRIALSGGDGLSAQVWTQEEGVSCKGRKVLRLTRAGIFEGRYGAETAAVTAAVSDWSDDGIVVKTTVTIHSELVSAPDVVLGVTATRAGGHMTLDILRERVTPTSRYTSAPQYDTDRIAGIWYPCTP